MNMKEKVKRILLDLPQSRLKVEIEPDFGPRVVAVVISDEFERMDEGERQRIVWKKLLDELDPYEQTWVEFVHTMAPSELEPAPDPV